MPRAKKRSGISVLLSVRQRVRLRQTGFARIEEVARYLAVSRTVVTKAVDSGDLHYAMFGEALRIPWFSVIEYAERCSVSGTKKEP